MEQDVLAAIDFLKKEYTSDVILWGSSYSSSLALMIGAEDQRVEAIIAFSPGDYFGDAKESLAVTFEGIKKPFLVTSSKAEASALSQLLGNKKYSGHQVQFIPSSDGFHGSRALWDGQAGSEEYWRSVSGFLDGLK